MTYRERIASALAVACYLVACLAALASQSGCAAPTFDPTAIDGEAAPASDDPGAVCLETAGPCVGVAYCDELGAAEQPTCELTADGSCQRWNVDAGASCFPAVDGPRTGYCDGAGTCR